MINDRVRLKGSGVVEAAKKGLPFFCQSGECDHGELASALAQRFGVKQLKLVSGNPSFGEVEVKLNAIPEGEIHRARCEFYLHC